MNESEPLKVYNNISPDKPFEKHGSSNGLGMKTIKEEMEHEGLSEEGSDTAYFNGEETEGFNERDDDDDDEAYDD